MFCLSEDAGSGYLFLDGILSGEKIVSLSRKLRDNAPNLLPRG